MSTEYGVWVCTVLSSSDVVRILKDSVWPAFTLIAVAKPSIVGLPWPETCQPPSPALEFSQMIGLLPGSHGAALAAGAAATAAPPPTSATTATWTIRRRNHPEPAPRCLYTPTA